MSDLVSVIQDCAINVFPQKQFDMSQIDNQLNLWIENVAPICCDIVVDKLNSEPHISNIDYEFAYNSHYTGRNQPNQANTLSIVYDIEDQYISNDDHTSLLSMDTIRKEQIVAKLVQDHYSNAIEIFALQYSHYNGSDKTIRTKIRIREKPEDNLSPPPESSP